MPPTIIVTPGSASSSSSSSVNLLLGMQACGLFLVFPGTWIAYVAYANSLPHWYEIPVITDLFRDWPVSGSLTFGLGTTLICSGLTGAVVLRATVAENLVGRKFPWRRLACIMVLAYPSVWLVISTSCTGCSDLYQWMHKVAALVFTSLVLYALTMCLDVLHNICSQVMDTHAQINAEALLLIGKWFIVPVSFLSILGCLISVITDVYMKKLLAVSELVFLTASGSGYAVVVYIYWTLEWGYREHVHT